jgi:hypothetical protein
MAGWYGRWWHKTWYQCIGITLCHHRSLHLPWSHECGIEELPTIRHQEGHLLLLLLLGVSGAANIIEKVKLRRFLINGVFWWTSDLEGSRNESFNPGRHNRLHEGQPNNSDPVQQLHSIGLFPHHASMVLF